MTRFVHGVSGAALLSICAACGDSSAGGDANPDAGGHVGDAGSQGDALDFSEFDARFESFLEENGLSGGSAAVVHKERGLVHEAGYGAYEPDRVYLIASASKVLSVGVLMRLVDQGLLDLDAPLTDYLSEWGDAKSDLTVASLVSNSSGLVSLTENATYAPYLCQYIPNGTLTACAQSIYNADDAADRKPPDTMFAYGGGQWQLSGGVAEVVSGKQWATLVEETYVVPCGAATLGYSNHYSQANSDGDGLNYPSFFMADAATLPETENPSVEGGAYISVGDYAKILLMHLRGGLCGDERVLSSQAIATMQQDRIAEVYDGATSNPTLEGYGLGWWIDRTRDGLVVDPGAYGAVAWLDLTRDYGAFVALESSAATGEALRAAVQPVLEQVFDAR